jgi:hypothetical protein
MKKHAFNAKWIAIFVVAVIAMFGGNNHFYQPESTWTPQAIQITPLAKPKLRVTSIVPTLDPLQLECLAKGIYYEARGEIIHGQIAVARVIMNRVKHHSFGNTPCAVVNQANIVNITNTDGETVKVKVCQFSYMCENKSAVNKNSQVYQRALKIAQEVLLYDAHAEILPKNTLFFHSVNVAPNWGYRRVAVIGNHVFYAKGK